MRIVLMHVLRQFRPSKIVGLQVESCKGANVTGEKGAKMLNMHFTLHTIKRSWCTVFSTDLFSLDCIYYLYSACLRCNLNQFKYVPRVCPIPFKYE